MNSIVHFYIEGRPYVLIRLFLFIHFVSVTRGNFEIFKSIISLYY